MWLQILAVCVVAAVFLVRLVLALNDRPTVRAGTEAAKAEPTGSREGLDVVAPHTPAAAPLADDHGAGMPARSDRLRRQRAGLTVPGA